MTSMVSVRLPDKTLRALEEITAVTERSKTFLIRKALETYLEEYADYQIALDRLRDKDDDIISSEEMRAHLGL